LNSATVGEAEAIDRRLPGLFVCVGLVFGLLNGAIIPPMQGDDAAHFARAYSVSRGVCVASPDIDIPQSFEKVNHLFPPFLQLIRKISFEDLRTGLKIPLDADRMAGNGRERSMSYFINQNVYFCAAYVPEAMVLFAARQAGLPPLLSMYLCRLVNLGCYLGLTFLALRLLPDFRIVLFCIALLPTALRQAASVSIDSVVFGVSFLFVAWVFRLAFAPEARKIGIREYAITAVMIVFLAISKTLVSPVLLLFLIPKERFPAKPGKWLRGKWLASSAGVLLAVGCAALWLHVNEPNLRRLTESRMGGGIDVAGNARFVWEHPREMARIAMRSFGSPRYLYFNFRQFAGTVGWRDPAQVDWVALTCFALLAAAAVTQTRATKLTRPVRGFLVLVAAAAVATTAPVGWLGDVSRHVLQTPAVLRTFTIPLPARYWYPHALASLVLFSTGRTRFNARWFVWIAVGVLAAVNLVTLDVIRRMYYG